MPNVLASTPLRLNTTSTRCVLSALPECRSQRIDEKAPHVLHEELSGYVDASSAAVVCPRRPRIRVTLRSPLAADSNVQTFTLYESFVEVYPHGKEISPNIETIVAKGDFFKTAKDAVSLVHVHASRRETQLAVYRVSSFLEVHSSILAAA